MHNANTDHSGGMRNLTFSSWNVRGLNDPVKRGKVLSHLKKLASDIIFVQETHLNNKSHNRLRAGWIGEVYHSAFSSKARGAAILLRKGLPFTQKQTIADKEGRYVILIGEIYNLSLTLVNLYAPNTDNPVFFQKVFSLIPDISQTNLIVGGDFNTVLDTYLDRSSKRHFPKNASSEFLNVFIKNSNVLDMWRALNPSGRDYSFYSPVHNSYSRIDYFLVDAKLAPFALNAQYHSIVISDHSPLSFSMRLDHIDKPHNSWRLNPQLLTDKKFCEYLTEQMSLYFECNDIPGTSSSILWEAFKAFIRGSIISFEASRKKENLAKLQDLEKQIKALDNENSCTPSTILHNKISNLKYEYNKIMSAKISKAFLYTRQRFFEFGDKPDKLLARQLRKMESDRTIHKIKAQDNTILTKLKDVNNRFFEFYTELYTSKATPDSAAINHFLDRCDLPKLDPKDCDSLNAEITAAEIRNAIASLKGNKTPGPDGLPGELYKKYCEKLSPYLLRVFLQAQNDDALPPTLTEATITLIHKKGKDPLEVGAYRPISLLNVDGKLFAKLLANRLSPLLERIVHPDQTGFIPNRNSFFNLRRLFNIMYTKRDPTSNLVIVALDAEKAFDQIEWHYLFEVLSRFNLGSKFLSLVKLIYKHPTARILTNRTLSAPFKLHRGTRQGCPLSPLIFALAIEPLAQNIRLDPQMHGYTTKGTINKISLYADDILLFITHPQSTIPVLLNKINLFGTFSGYRINWTKSVLMPMFADDTTSLVNFPFTINSNKFTYLGIEVTKHYTYLFQENYLPLVERLRSKLLFWDTLPISLIGRINAIKMIFLPQLLYLFQNIPIFLKKVFFKRLDSLIVPFLWRHKPPRISKKYLCKSKRTGGLALPNFIHYYWASMIRTSLFWLKDLSSTPTWLLIEQEDCYPFALSSILLAPIRINKSLYNNNPIIHNTIRIWKQIQSSFDLNPIPPMLPIDKNPTFVPSGLSGVFSTWSQKGIKLIGDLYVGGVFASFSQLQQKFGLVSKNFFQYLQIRDYIRKHLKDFESEPKSLIYDCMKFYPNETKLISRIYNTLISLSSPSVHIYKSKWEVEIGEPIADEMWERGLEKVNTCSYSAKHCLIQFKIIHMLHYTKEKLHRIFPETSDLCDKCKSSVGTPLHSYVLCPKICSFWIDVFHIMSEVMKTAIKPEPLPIILGILDSSINLSHAQQCFVSYGIIIAKKLILTMWKSERAPTSKMWLQELTATLHMERIRHILKDKLHFFDKTWQPLLSYLTATIPPNG